MRFVEQIKNKWIESTALIVALFALSMSWQANSIALQQITPNVVIIDVQKQYYSGISSVISGEYPRHIHCVHMMRVTNLGGANTDIVGFGAKFSLEEEFLEGKDSKGHYIFEMSGDDTLGSGALSFFSAKLVEIDAPMLEENTAQVIESPIHLNAYETNDINSVVSFRVNHYPNKYSLSETASHSPPFEVQYELYLSNGTQISSPTAQCGY